MLVAFGTSFRFASLAVELCLTFVEILFEEKMTNNETNDSVSDV